MNSNFNFRSRSVDTKTALDVINADHATIDYTVFSIQAQRCTITDTYRSVHRRGDSRNQVRLPQRVDFTFRRSVDGRSGRIA